MAQSKAGSKPGAMSIAAVPTRTVSTVDLCREALVAFVGSDIQSTTAECDVAGFDADNLVRQ